MTLKIKFENPTLVSASWEERDQMNFTFNTNYTFLSNKFISLKEGTSVLKKLAPQADTTFDAILGIADGIRSVFNAIMTFNVCINLFISLLLSKIWALCNAL